jgi:hypothetical protein
MFEKKQYLILFICIIITIGCRKNNEDAEMTLIIVDGNKQTLDSAEVILYPNYQKKLDNRLDTILYSNSDGIVHFSYPYECYLYVYITYRDSVASLTNEKELYMQNGKHLTDTITLW